MSLYSIIVILSNKTVVYDFLQLTVREKIETCTNDNGICAMNGSKDNSVLATLTAKEGTVQVIHFDKQGAKQTINAHQNMIVAIALNNDGYLLATASLKVNK